MAIPKYPVLIHCINIAVYPLLSEDNSDKIVNCTDLCGYKSVVKIMLETIFGLDYLDIMLS